MRLAIQDALWYWMALQFLFSLLICNLKNHLIPGEAAGIQPHLACDGHGPKGRLWCCAENEWNTRLSRRGGEWDRRQLDESHFSAGETWHIPLVVDTSAFPYLQTLHQDQIVSSPHTTFEVAQLYWKNNSAFNSLNYLWILDFRVTDCHPPGPFQPMSLAVYLAHASSSIPLWGSCGGNFQCLLESTVDMSTALASPTKQVISPQKVITLVKGCCCSCFLSCPSFAWKCLLGLTNHFPKGYRLTSL